MPGTVLGTRKTHMSMILSFMDFTVFLEKQKVAKSSHTTVTLNSAKYHARKSGVFRGLVSRLL